jgi:hypothetical protein
MSKDNILSIVGDSILIEVKPKANGIISNISSYKFNFDNEDVRDINFFYRIRQEDIFYTDWQEINSSGSDLSSIKITQDSELQFRFVRVSKTYVLADISFLNLTLDGDYITHIIKSPVLNSSIFKSIAWEDDTESLSRNLFKKLYYRGIIPNYIKRGDNIDRNEDEDYVILFSSIAKFFATIIEFLKRFENIDSNIDLLQEYVEQKGLFFNRGKATLDELQYLAKNYYHELSKRGTEMIMFRKGHILNDSKETNIDGEFIRLIQSTVNNELLYELIPSCNVGWCLGYSSPMYKGTNSKDINLNKTPENTEDFKDISKYRTFGNVSLQTDSNKTFLRIGNNSGLGSNDNSDEKSCVVSSRMDYEISFSFRTSSNNGNISFSVKGFDNLGNILNDSFIHSDNGEITNYFVQNLSLSHFVINKWYCVKCIVHCYFSQNKYNDVLNIGFGNNLYFNNPFTRKIIPTIETDSQSTIDIWNYKIRPLARGTNIIPLRNKQINNAFSIGFLQSNRIFHVFFENKNKSQSKSDITDLIERYLLPFSVTDILTYIDN